MIRPLTTTLLFVIVSVLVGCASTEPRGRIYLYEAEAARDDFTPLESDGAIIRLSGMHCPSCAASVERILGQMWCVERVEAHASTGRVHVTFDPNETRPSPADLAITVVRTGYELVSIEPI